MIRGGPGGMSGPRNRRVARERLPLRDSTRDVQRERGCRSVPFPFAQVIALGLPACQTKNPPYRGGFFLAFNVRLLQ
jgi:hypothetical protein